MTKINLINSYNFLVKEVRRVWGLESVEIYHRPEDYERKIICSIIIDLGQPLAEHELLQKVYDLASNTLPYKDLMARNESLQKEHELKIQELEQKIKELEFYKIHFNLEYNLRHGEFIIEQKNQKETNN